MQFSVKKNHKWTLVVPLLAITLMTLLAGNRAQAEISQFKLENPQSGHGTRSMGNSISVDGNTMVVGAKSTDPNEIFGAGVARVYKTDDLGNWTLEAELIASDANESDYFGCSVAISGDTIVVGAFYSEGSVYLSGSAYIFKRSGGIWTEQQKLTASDGAWADHFGRAVSVSGDTVLIGAYLDDDGGNNFGSAYVFTRSGGIWTERQKLTSSDGAESDRFGNSVSLSGDTLVVGAYRDDDVTTNSGSAYVFTRSGDVWTEQQKLLASDTANSEQFAYSVSVSGDTIVVGANQDCDGKGEDIGSAYIYARSDGVWTEQQKLTADTNPMGDDHFGISVSVSNDTVVIGASRDREERDIDSGFAYIYTRSGTTWSRLSKIQATDFWAGDRFGSSVSVSGDWFGDAVSISGDTAVIGAQYDDDREGYSGSDYVFTRSDGVWTLRQKLGPSDTVRNYYFGLSVAISGDTLVIGASDSAFVFTRTNGLWTQQQKLVPSVPASYQLNALYGSSVSVSDDTVVVGATEYYEWWGGNGTAYIFTPSGDTWTEKMKLTASDAESGDEFGYALAVEKGQILAGARRKDAPERHSGAAYVFEITHPVVFETDGTPDATFEGSTMQTVGLGDDCVSVTAKAPAGYKFVKWTVDGADYSTDRTLTVTDVFSTMTLTAVFSDQLLPGALTHSGGVKLVLPNIILSSGSDTEATLKVWNAGDLDLEITTATVMGEGFSLLAPATGYPILLRSSELFPGDIQEFSIGFDRTQLATPNAPGTFTGLLTLIGDDPTILELETTILNNASPASAGDWILY